MANVNLTNRKINSSYHQGQNHFSNRAFTSPLFWTSLIGITTLFTDLMTLFAPTLISSVPLVITNGAAFAALGYHALHPKWALYEMSLSQRIFLNALSEEKWPWWNQITNQIILGAIPLKNQGHFEKILTETKTAAVLTLVEDYELYNNALLSVPVRPSEWKNNGIKQLHLSTPDCIPINSDLIERGISFMREQIKQEKTVYVHCKAGQGRSASMVIYYLIKYEKMTPDEAISYVLEKRPQMSLNTNMKKSIFDYYEQLKDNFS